MALNDNDLLLINDSQNSNEAKKIKYSTLKSNINGDSGNDLQAVTDNGNHTDNDVKIGNTEAAPNISLNADGSAEFSSGKAEVISPGVFRATRAAGANNYIWLGYEGNDQSNPATSFIKASGDASFGSGNISLNANGNIDIANEGNYATNGGVSLGRLGILNAYRATDIANSEVLTLESNVGGNKNRKITFKADGSAEFASDNISLNADGSASFARDVRSAGQVLATNNTQYAVLDSRGYVNIRKDDNSDTAALKIFKGGSLPTNEQVVINNDGSAIFKGAVQTAGGVVTPSAVIQTETDNPANYTTTTSTEIDPETGEEITVETQVYNGPTLDVKERVLNLVARLDALEANEVIDDAVDTSLLSLLASASARLDSIEARLAALEGGN